MAMVALLGKAVAALIALLVLNLIVAAAGLLFHAWEAVGFGLAGVIGAAFTLGARAQLP